MLQIINRIETGAYRIPTGNFLVCGTKIKEQFNPGSNGPVEQAWIFGGKIIFHLEQTVSRQKHLGKL